MTNITTFARQIRSLSIVNVLIGIAGILLLPIVTKSLSSTDYGTLTQVVVTTSLVPLIICLGLQNSLIRFLAPENNGNKIRDGFYSMLSIVMVMGLIASFIFLILSGPLSQLLFDGNDIVTMIVSAMISVESINIYCINYFRAFQQTKLFSVAYLSRECFKIFFIAIPVISGYSLVGAVVGLLIADILVTALVIALIVNEIGIYRPKFINLHDFLRYGLPTVYGGISSWIMQVSDRYVIGLYLGNAPVAYYSPAYTLGNFAYFSAMPVLTILTSILSRYHDNDQLGEAKRFMSYVIKYYLAIAIPSVVGLSLMSLPILTVLTTQEIANNGYFITPFVALSSMFYGAFLMLAEVVNVKKKTRITSTIVLVSAIVNLALNLIIVPYTGIIGSAAVTLIASTIAMIAVVHFSRPYEMINFDASYLPRFIIAALAMAVIILLLPPVGLLQIFSIIMLSVIVYFAVVIAFGGFKKEEINFFINLLLPDRQMNVNIPLGKMIKR